MEKVELLLGKLSLDPFFSWRFPVFEDDFLSDRVPQSKSVWGRTCGKHMVCLVVVLTVV